MKISSYIREKLFNILLFSMTLFLVYLFLSLFNVNKYLIICIIVLLIFYIIIVLLYDFLKRYSFYSSFKKSLDGLDKKYLITEMVNNSNFLDGKLLLSYLYEIDKSMHEEVNNYKYNNTEFKEYIELWCHEIKTPIATAKLLIENNENEITRSILEEIVRLENYIEQVLFYSRSDFVDKDYIVSKVNLKGIVDNVVKRNKKDLINKKIKIDIDSLGNVMCDAKWIEFIINQIVINSIKYSKDKNCYIKFYSKCNKNNFILYVEDDGIGIDNSEIDRVFDKGFTGSNGRKKYNSTGIGLYLCKKLCIKLGCEIFISSEIDKKTIVSIVFPNNSMIDNLTNL